MLRKRPAALAGAAVAAVFVVSGCASLPSEQAGAGSSAKATYPTMTATHSKPTTVRPGAQGLTEEDLARQAESDRAQASESWEYVQSLIAKGVDVATLPRFETMALIEGGAATPKEQAAKSSTVFVGTVKTLHFQQGGTYADVVIDKVVKGNVRAGSVLNVRMGFTLTPNADSTGGALAVTPGSPVLPAGTQVVFMPRDLDKGIWSGGGYFQAFPIQDGLVSAEPSSPYGRLVSKVPLDKFLSELSS